MIDIRGILSNSLSTLNIRGINTAPYFIPLNLKVLNQSLGSLIHQSSRQPTVFLGQQNLIDLTDLRDKIVSHIHATYSNNIVLIGDDIIVNGSRNLPMHVITSRFTPAVVYLNSKSVNNIAGVLFNEFNRAQSELLNGYLNKEFIKFLRKSLNAGTNVEFDLAYIFKSNEPEDVALGSKIKKLFGILNTVSQNTIHTEGIDTSANKLNVTQTKILVESLLQNFAVDHEIGPVIEAAISTEVSKFVAKINANIVIIQDRYDTTDVAKVVQSDTVVEKLKDSLLNTGFLDRIKNRITSIFLGKKPATTKTKEKIAPIDARQTTKVKLNSVKGQSSTYVSERRQEVSLISIQNLLNDNIFPAIKEQMGSKPGGGGPVLNYDTGRLGRSFKVTAVSQERSGAITAFYIYMKNPYATFAPGGVQSRPTTRDPKLLGERAIRSIAEKNITARLRAVLI